jgi:plastocyanin
MRTARLVLVLAASAVGLAACSSGTSSSTTTSTSPSSTAPTSTTTAGAGSSTSGSASAATIVIKNFAFSPVRLVVTPGEQVTVHNEDQVAHTVTSTGNGPSFNTGDVAPGTTTTFSAPSTAGTYPYICNIHQYMAGTLVVTG